MSWRDQPPPRTAQEALQQRTVDDLKQFCLLFTRLAKDLPKRKDDLIAFLLQHLEGPRLRELWQRLSEVQKNAVSEAVHGAEPRFDADRFEAKYGANPYKTSGESEEDSGSRSWRPSYRPRKPSAFDLFFTSHGWMPEELRQRLRSFVPKPAAEQLQTLDELPEQHELLRQHYNYFTRKEETSVELRPMEVREMEHAAQDDLLAALESGKSVRELREGLLARSTDELPQTVAQFLDDIETRAGRLRDAGTARLIECADVELAALITHDRTLQGLCMPAGDRYVAVPAASEASFRKALRKVGYSLGPAPGG
jgi:hypothetical protein